MNDQTIQALKRLNNEFYRANHASFSQSRQHAWPGWQRVLEALEAPPCTVIDIACGNMRFKKYIEGHYEGNVIRYHGVDSCVVLAEDGALDSCQEVDIIDALIDDSLTKRMQVTSSDLTVCFGFLHHIPTTALRSRLLESLLAMTSERGVVAVSFWQFALNEKMLAKAQVTTAEGCNQLGLSLEEGDYLLGWNKEDGAYRYCHSFTDTEIDALLSGLPGDACVIDRYHSDGRTGEMNAYAVIRAGR